MSRDHFEAHASEYRRYEEQLFGKVMFFSFLLLMSHVMTISPSDVTIIGLKVAIDNVTVIRGGLALLLLYYMLADHVATLNSSLVSSLDINKRMLRQRMRKAKKRYIPFLATKPKIPTALEAKRRVRRSIAIQDITLTPFVLALALMLLSAVLVALFDVWRFAAYVIHRLLELNS